MKIISWNINSLRLRLPLLQMLVLEQNPDIICLQETKVQDSDFPLSAVKKLGFEYVYFSGQKSYNGVAIISKMPLTSVTAIDILDPNHKRHICATLPNGAVLHNFYVPAGGDIADPDLNPKFDFKLKFLDWMTGYFHFTHKKNDAVIMVGDINIAPLEHDVWSHKQLLSVVSHTPIEVEKINILKQTLDWIDTHRLHVDEKQKLYSWWSYRGLEPFKSNRGRRLDHIWTTSALKNNIKKTAILKDFRTKEQPSDHVPITIEFDF
jgi:exodeoxyribonuclease III